jgi:Eukaryotic protein of unknown function (DUF829)
LGKLEHHSTVQLILLIGSWNEMAFNTFAGNDFNGESQASDCLVVTSVAKRPRAIVVILGYIASSADELSKYAQLYQDYKCSTICASAPLMSIISNDTATIGEVAITVCREAARLIRMAEFSEMGFGRIPVLIHVLGNGGALVLEELEQRLHEVIPKKDIIEMIKVTESKAIPKGRAAMQKATSSRAIIERSRSDRNLMRPPLVKAVSAPILLKGSTQSLLTATLSDDDEDSDMSPITRLKVKKQDSVIRSDSVSIRKLDPCADTPIVACLCSPNHSERFTSIDDSIPIPCSNLQASSPRQLSEPSIKYGILSQYPSISKNSLHLRLQRRRRRKLISPCVRRIDIERSGLIFSAVPRYNPEDRAYNRDLELFASRLVLGSIVFDSGPYRSTLENELNALNSLMTSSIFPLKFMAQSALIGSQSWNGLNFFPSFVVGQNLMLSRADQFWKNMEDIQLTRRHAFIFSMADKVCNYKDIHDLMDEHRKNGIQVFDIMLVASGHLQHRQRRFDKYSEFVERVLDSLDGRKTIAQESISEWFDSDEDGTEAGHEIIQETPETLHSYSIVEALSSDAIISS